MAKKTSDPITDLGAIALLSEMPEAIRRVDKAIQNLYEAGLTRRALVVLINDAAVGVTKTQINAVLDALPLLASRFLVED